jgi:glycogen operon protein
VVFNHTAEGNEAGPTLSFRGLANRNYYILAQDRQYYANYTGCGNTMNGNHSIARRMILDCLHYWVQVMHVDGFRFDLASVLARDENGQPLRDPPILWDIETDPVLAGCKIIAEAWDAAGLYQVGSFVGHRWAEWNGHFRDDVRRFVRGDDGVAGQTAARMLGSPDVYSQPHRDPYRSINFITCHDGFTLYDLVSYNTKHNEDNGENNRDGNDNNCSWNCGAEGPTTDHDILGLRDRQVKNLLTMLLLAQGTPMLLMGDEVRRTQNGNNNAYCQDTELSWFDWRKLSTDMDLLRFVQGLVQFRREHGNIFDAPRFWSSESNHETPQITWHGVNLNQPDWGFGSRTLSYTLNEPGGAPCVHVILNAYWEPLLFQLPLPGDGRRWHCVVDTTVAPPNDIADSGAEPALPKNEFPAGARSAVVLLAR